MGGKFAGKTALATGSSSGIGLGIARAFAAEGAIDILLNNAGIRHVAPVDEFPVDKWDAILALNFADDSAGQTNGTAITVDGGWTAR
jgi:3-hydroxybutyrate dehydrogenase